MSVQRSGRFWGVDHCGDAPWAAFQIERDAQVELCEPLWCVEHLLRERELFIDNLLVRIRLITDMILVDRPRAMGV